MITINGKTLPGGKVIVKQEGDRFTGTAIEYQFDRDAVGGPKVVNKLEVPFLDAKFDGSRLVFRLRIDYEIGRASCRERV